MTPEQHKMMAELLMSSQPSALEQTLNKSQNQNTAKPVDQNQYASPEDYMKYSNNYMASQQNNVPMPWPSNQIAPNPYMSNASDYQTIYDQNKSQNPNQTYSNPYGTSDGGF